MPPHTPRFWCKKNQDLWGACFYHMCIATMVAFSAFWMLAKDIKLVVKELSSSQHQGWAEYQPLDQLLSCHRPRWRWPSIWAGGQERNLELRHCVFCDGWSARLKFVSEEDIFPVPDSWQTWRYHCLPMLFLCSWALPSSAEPMETVPRARMCWSWLASFPPFVCFVVNLFKAIHKKLMSLTFCLFCLILSQGLTV